MHLLTGAQAWFEATVRTGEILLAKHHLLFCGVGISSIHIVHRVSQLPHWSTTLTIPHRVSQFALWGADVNSGINTREKLKRHDPTLAKLLAFAYGTMFKMSQSRACETPYA
jgi:hypothetical protein